MNFFSRRRRRNADLDQEIAAHLNMAIQDRIARGESPEEARLAAQREFGNVGLVKEVTRAAWTWTAIETAFQDLRAAARGLAKAPGFTAAAVALIALGIGGNASVYSMIHSAVTKPAAGVTANRLVTLEQIIDGHLDDPSNSFPNFLDFAAQSRTVQPLTARGFARFTLTVGDGTYSFGGAPVMPNYFDTLGVRLVKGRSFTADEAQLNGTGLAVIISNGVWQDVFHEAADVVGRPIALNGHAATVIGVAAPGFHGSMVAEQTQIWVPLLAWTRATGSERELYDRAVRSVEMTGRLAPGVTLDEARTEFATISRRLQLAWPAADKNKLVLIEPYSSFPYQVLQRGRIFMAIPMAVALIVLLVVCANVANLAVARSHVRQREMALRQSLGASRTRVLRMLMAEALLLSLVAWIAACAFAEWSSRAIAHTIPTSVEVDFTPDWVVLAYGLMLAVASAVVFTIGPALRLWRMELLPLLKSGGHVMAGGRSKLSSALVVLQLAFCVVLLTAAGLATRSLRLISDVGFNRDNLLVVSVNTSAAAAKPPQHIELLDRVRERLRATRGITSVSYVRVPPPMNWGGVAVRVPGMREPLRASQNFAAPQYFDTLGITMAAGREFNESDVRGTAPMVVINQHLADALWPGRPAVGRSLQLGDQREPVQVIGVLPSQFFGNSPVDTRPMYLFRSERQTPAEPGEATFIIRYQGQLDSIGTAVRGIIRQTEPRMPVVFMRTMDEQLEHMAAPALLMSTLLSFFSAGCLLTAAVGLYAVIAFNISKRTRDFGVRMALGASSSQILRMVFREGMILTGVGFIIGAALSLVVGRALHRLLVGVTPTDAMTWTGVFALIAAVSLLACYVPARRAAGVDPISALRED